jgi:predicted nucleic acid-binding protein
VTTYVDSSALVAVYVPERFSAAARRAVQAAVQVPFTPLHSLEVLNAFELLIGRDAMTRGECRAVQDQLQDDLASHRLVRLTLDLDQVFTNTSELSRAYTAKTLTRSLDLLHVAAAHLAMCTTFVSADDRQLVVARATGLKVMDIKTRTRSR